VSIAVIPAARSEAARTIETIDVRIGSVHMALEVSTSLATRLRARYQAFTVRHPEGASTPQLLLRSLVDDEWGGDDESAGLPNLRLDMLDQNRMRLSGDCAATLDFTSGRGDLEAGGAFVGLDALVRLSLSVLAAAEGWILFHGAAVELVSGGWALLVGHSGAGKSTAARAFVSYCDELVLSRLEGRDAVAASTPYWNGRPGRAPCRVVVCLERSEAPGSRFLRGREAVRALSPHVVRYAARDATDRAVFQRLCSLAGRVPVLLVRSRVGGSYPASLGLALESCGFALRSRAVESLRGDSP
jgi:hypothetical protein